MVFYGNQWFFIEFYGLKCVDARKPDSVIVLLLVVIHLDLELPLNSSSLPEPN